MSINAAVTTPNIVNGIDVDSVRALAEMVAGDPSTGKTHWKVSSKWQGQTRSRARITSFGLGADDIKRDFSIDIDEPVELGGTNLHANPQEHLLAAMNACMMVGYTALCALQNIRLEKLEIETTGEIDLRGFFGLDPSVAPGYENLNYVVTIKGDATEDEFRKIHEMVMATSPNFYNLSKPVALNPTFVVE